MWAALTPEPPADPSPQSQVYPAMLPSGSVEFRAFTVSRKSTDEKEKSARGGLFENTNHQTTSPATRTASKIATILTRGPRAFFAPSPSYLSYSSSSPPPSVGSLDSSSIGSPRHQDIARFFRRLNELGYRRKARSLFEVAARARMECARTLSPTRHDVPANQNTLTRIAIASPLAPGLSRAPMDP